MSARPRVLVVDDSAFARKVLRELLGQSGRFELVGFARDGLEALEKVAELKPDVVTLDLVMPHLDGPGFLRALPPAGAPRVVVVSFGDAQSELAVEALSLGAVSLVHKPTNLATDRLYEMSAGLISAVELAAGISSPAARPAPSIVPALRAPLPRSSAQILVVGASTGGPQAISTLLRGLPGDFPMPVAVVLHIPVGFTEAFARRLDGECALEVVEAEEGTLLTPGRAVVARAGMHLKLSPQGELTRAHLDIFPTETLHRPAVDVLFRSAAERFGAGTVAVVLSGMGDDGLAGSREVVRAGGVVLAEDASTCVVYGMPRSVVEAGLASEVRPIHDMARSVRQLAGLGG